MPEKEYVWLPRSEILTFEEIAALVDVFADLGVDRIRLTGGEPLLRSDLARLVRALSDSGRLTDVSLTTNGILLADQAEELRAAGLDRVTVSLDTLDPERFRALTRFDQLGRVLEGIDAAGRAGFRPLKIDTVLVRGVNEDELGPILEFGRRAGAEVRFIEYMDVGGATHWRPDKVVPRGEILAEIERRFGPATPLPGRGSAPAERFALSDGTVFGVVASTTAPFCGACDRSRLTADGLWYLCLYATAGTDLRAALRSGASRDELTAAIAGAWRGRADRGAEARLGRSDRSRVLPVAELRRDPHLEMHTRGG